MIFLVLHMPRCVILYPGHLTIMLSDSESCLDSMENVDFFLFVSLTVLAGNQFR